MNWLYPDTKDPRLDIFLAFGDTFPGLVEDYPFRSEKSSEVGKALLKEISPHFGLPSSIQSESESAFVSEITQKFSQFLGIR